jgi:transcriptional regulator with XRE-family HTH domain
MKRNQQSNLMRRIGEKIHAERIARNISQEAFAEAVGVSRQFISMMENGNNAAKIDTYHSIANALNIPLSALFREDIDSSRTEDILFIFEDCSTQETAALLEVLCVVKKQIRAVEAIKIADA